MKNISYHYSTITLFLWAALLVLTGTNFRHRTGTEMVEMDYMVYIQILVALAAIVWSSFRIINYKKWHIGIKTLMLYLLFALFSAAFSPYPVTVLGYWFLLAGVGFLTFDMVVNAESQKDLNRFEITWLIIMTLIILKDSAESLISPEFGAGTSRLGMGVTHANNISFYAALAFWISFGRAKNLFSFLMWIPRALFLFVILLSRTRISMVALVVGGLIYVWYKFRYLNPKESSFFRIIFICLTLLSVTVIVWLFTLDASWVNSSLDYFNRSQSVEELFSGTGRTEIWATVFERIFDNGINLIFGHGYGMSRFIINTGNTAPFFFAFHAHNGMLEILLATGLAGIISFLTFSFYGMKWIVKYNSLRNIYSEDLIIRAIIVISMVLIQSLTEATIGVKINPTFMIFIFYIIILDFSKNDKFAVETTASKLVNTQENYG